MGFGPTTHSQAPFPKGNCELRRNVFLGSPPHVRWPKGNSECLHTNILGSLPHIWDKIGAKGVAQLKQKA